MEETPQIELLRDELSKEKVTVINLQDLLNYKDEEVIRLQMEIDDLNAELFMMESYIESTGASREDVMEYDMEQKLKYKYDTPPGRNPKE